jgi:hypothetical protein
MRGYGLGFSRPAKSAPRVLTAEQIKKNAEYRKINEENEAKALKELAARGTTAGRRRKHRKTRKHKKTHRRR